LNDEIASWKVLGSHFSYVHLAYLIIAALSIGPTVHWIILHGGLDNDHVLKWLPNLLILYAATGSAFLFHVSMVPERFLPGTFDMLGYSHQWWHVLILVAMGFWQKISLDYLALHRSYPHYCFTHHGLRNLTSS
uniref:Progestin and adipoQ receptor family member 3 n=1 Tax=Gongylonema pulchrum TaxID=637853 RepID=A0A183CWV3_9BILA